MSIKVVTAFCNTLFSEAVKELLLDTEDINVVETLRTAVNPYKFLDSVKPDIILVDYNTLYGHFERLDADHGLKFILFDTWCAEDRIIPAVIHKGVKGVLMPNSTSLLLKKAIRSVAEGEIWLDKVNVKNLLGGINVLKKTRPALSEREREVISLVGQGFRNKEIAEKLEIGEPTVKTHLQRIFNKLDLKSRPQLISFAIRNTGHAN